MLVLKVIILSLLQISPNLVKCGVIHSENQTLQYSFQVTADTAEKTAATAIAKFSEGMTNTNLTDDLENWQAPRFIQENFPYYIAGYDEERRPIFIVEMGRMDLRRMITEQGEEVQTAFFKYLNQTALRLVQIMNNQSTQDFPVTDLVAIIDFDGFHVRQLTSLPNLQLLLKIVSTFSNFLARHLHSVYIINATYLAEQFINLTKPVFGGTFSRFEVFGTSKKSWMPVIRRVAGENQLPSWYGGSSQFKPVAVFGR